MPNYFIKFFIIPFLLFSMLFSFSEESFSQIGQAYKIGKLVMDGLKYVKNPEKINFKKLAELGLQKGKQPGALGKAVNELVKDIPDAVKREKALNSIYAQILVEQKRLSPKEAEEILINLSSTPRLHSLFSKMAGASEIMYKGHKFELMTANALHKKGFKIADIDKTFNDGLRKAPTDIDIVVKKGNNVFPMELKNYENVTLSNLDSFRAKMESLKNYCVVSPQHNENCNPILIISKLPSDANVRYAIKSAAKQRGVTVIYGDSESAAHQIENLAKSMVK